MDPEYVAFSFKDNLNFICRKYEKEGGIKIGRSCTVRKKTSRKGENKVSRRGEKHTYGMSETYSGLPLEKKNCLKGTVKQD